GAPRASHGGLSEDLGLTRDAHLGSTASEVDVLRGPPGGFGVGPGGRKTRPDPCDQQVVEGGATRRVPRLQPKREGPNRRLGILGAPDYGRAGIDPVDLGRGPRSRPREFHRGNSASSIGVTGRSRQANRLRGPRLDAAARAVGPTGSGRIERRALAASL